MKSREVMVGDVGVGGQNPIRIQSMTTSDTTDVATTVKQIVQLAGAGCEIARVTVPSLKDARAVKEIRKQLKSQKMKIPLVADIHFTPRVAMEVVDYVDKIRINPGNFADKKKFQKLEYNDKEYHLELERIAELFIPLIKRCQQSGVAMRIGTNHGSLSDRIMNRYGDTPQGMCESALEFIKIAESESYYDIIVSMKSSNPQVMVQTYRMLAARFLQMGMQYPFHLGVTEAGYGREGRVKSCSGIGTLLEDGIGDTIRVSLTEDAVEEIPVAAWIAQYYNQKSVAKQPLQPFQEFRNPFEYSRMKNNSVQLKTYELGNQAIIRTEIGFHEIYNHYPEIIKFIQQAQKRNDMRKLESVHLGIQDDSDWQILPLLQKILSDSVTLSLQLQGSLYGKEMDFIEQLALADKIIINQPNSELLEKLPTTVFEYCLDKIDGEQIQQMIPFWKRYKNRMILSLKNGNVLEYRKLLSLVHKEKIPILIADRIDDFTNGIYSSSILGGGLLMDGIGDMLRLELQSQPHQQSLDLLYDILQAVRQRTTKTEFISCPSCGRTLFDLQSTTARIKTKTEHLQGVKIAIMGCIVNGPGEMADADFGYVGAGPGKIHLYKGKQIVKKSIPAEIGDEELIALIKQENMWIEPNKNNSNAD